jgi:hypothetical protein
MQFLGPGQVPKRTRKKELNVIERRQEFAELLRTIRRLAPGEQAGLSFDSTDQETLGLRAPARVAADSLRRWLAKNQLDDQYVVRKFKVEGRQFVSVTRKRQKRDVPVQPAIKGAPISRSA